MDLEQSFSVLAGPVSKWMTPEKLKCVLADMAIGMTSDEIVQKYALAGQAAWFVYNDKTLKRFQIEYQKVIRKEIIAKVRRTAQRAAGEIERFFQEATEQKDRLKALEMILKYFVDLERIEVDRERTSIERQKATNERKRFDIMRAKNAVPAEVESFKDMSSGQLAKLLDHGAKITGIDLSGVKDLEEVVDGLRVQGGEGRESPGVLAEEEVGSG